MTTVSDIFAAFNGPAEVGRIIDKPTEHATAMRRRGSIPVAYWPALIEAAATRNIERVNQSALIEAHAARRVAQPRAAA